MWEAQANHLFVVVYVIVFFLPFSGTSQGTGYCYKADQVASGMGPVGSGRDKGTEWYLVYLQLSWLVFPSLKQSPSPRYSVRMGDVS